MSFFRFLKFFIFIFSVLAAFLVTLAGVDSVLLDSEQVNQRKKIHGIIGQLFF
jgi:hypothetical protein